MKIAIVSAGYPSEGKSFFPFVKNLVDEFSRMGESCTVIAPQSITKSLLRRDKILPASSIYHVGENAVTVLRPFTISFSNFHLFRKIAYRIFKRSITRALESLETTPDVIYCHFWMQAFAAYAYANKHQIPLFVATGESAIPIDRLKEDSAFIKITNFISGVICVSSKSRDESIKDGLLKAGKPVMVAPNAINNNIFKKLDREECRRKLGIKENDFVVAFTGAFTDRKGILRLNEALKELNDSTIKAIFIGDGELQPDYKYTVFCNRIENHLIPEYLNSADVFVLPTRNEGCCNAIVEAMACGLPVISSDLPFNKDILDTHNGILINPNDIDEIALAIKTFRDNKEKRQQCALNALKKAEGLTISKRGAKIIEFINKNS